jgi:DNA mismatch endonuclease, patch repair protein
MGGGVTSQDIVSGKKRSEMMGAVGQKDTPPELAVRHILRSLGFGYRIRNRDLPGSPDIANRKRRWAVFVNGCFWHGHRDCPKTKGGKGGRIPKRNRDFWSKKIRDNQARDAKAVKKLETMGFRVEVVWECELKDPPGVRERLAARLTESDHDQGEG